MLVSILFSTSLRDSYTQENNSALFDSLNFYKNQIDKYQFSDTALLSKSKQSIQRLIEHSDDNFFLLYAYSRLANIYRADGEYTLAIRNFYNALEYADYAKSKIKIANIYDDLGRAYRDIGADDRMFESINQSVDLRESIDDYKGAHKSRMILCEYYRHIGNYIEAFRIGYDALDYFESQNDIKGTSLAYNNIALTYKVLRNYEKALELYEISYSNFRKMEYQRGMSMVLNNIGNLQLNRENYQDALNNLEKSLEIEKTLGNKFNILTRLNNIGLTYIYLGNHAGAIENFQTCITEYAKTNRKRSLANSYNSLGMCYEEMNLLDSAKFYYLKSIELCELLDLKNLHTRSALRISNIFKREQNYDSAYVYLSKYYEIFEIIERSKLTWQISAEEIEYIRLKNKRLKQVEKRNAALLTIIISGVLVLLVLISWIVVIKLKAKINKSFLAKQSLESEQIELRNQISNQNKELVSKVLQLSGDNSSVKFAIQKLKILKSDLGTSSKQKVQQVINDLEHSVNDTIWNEFEYRFTKVHPQFYKKLSLKIPNLTTSEKRLCALIHLNFSSKEIATIIKQSPKSVLVAKSRLRNKLNLSSSDKISNFLHRITDL